MCQEVHDRHPTKVYYGAHPNLKTKFAKNVTKFVCKRIFYSCENFIEKGYIYYMEDKER